LTRKNSGVSATGASTSRESAPARPALGVVTADGGLTIPPAVLDRMAADALLANRERLASYAPLIAEIENSEGAAKSAAAARLAVAVTSRTAYKRPADEVMDLIRERGGVDADFRRRLDVAHAGIAALNDRTERELAAKYGPKLWLAPPTVPVQPATPCPSWCVAEHQDDDPDTTHHGDLQWYGPLGFWLHQKTDGVTAIRMELETGMESEMLDAEQAEQLAVRLGDALRTYAAAVRSELPVAPYAPQSSQFPAGGAA
jgi:hypothetical protein